MTVAILAILASAAVPVTRFEVKRAKERELRYDLWQMRDAIDKYKDAADQRPLQTKVDSQNYPPDLETLVNGVDVQGKKLKFLRRIPVDPMTGKAEWGLRSMQDDPTAIPGAGKMSSTFTASPKAPLSTARSIRIGRREAGKSAMNSIRYRVREPARRGGEDGFTLIELMIVIVVIGVLATIAIPNYIRSLQASKEAVLKEDLHVLRQQIDAYTNDKEKAPQSLDDLVSGVI